MGDVTKSGLYEMIDGVMYKRDPQGGLVPMDGVPVRDVDVIQRQAASDSHLRFFREKPRQKMRRAEHVEGAVGQMVYDRADVTFHPDVKQVTDREYIEDLRHNPEFQPLPTYVNKLTLKNGKQVRPILRGEVGIIGATIYVLEPGFHEVPQVQVGAIGEAFQHEGDPGSEGRPADDGGDAPEAEGE